MHLSAAITAEHVCIALLDAVRLGQDSSTTGHVAEPCHLLLFCVQMVANSRSSEAFIAACLLTVGGSSLLTKQMGLSDTLGAFVAGVLLSETSFRTQVHYIWLHPVCQPAASYMPGIWPLCCTLQVGNIQKHMAAAEFVSFICFVVSLDALGAFPDLLWVVAVAG